MNSRILIYFAAFIMALAMTACFEENSTPETVMVQPGTTTRPLGPLRFQNPAGRDSSTANGSEPFTYTTCTMAREAGSVALVEFVDEGQLISVNEDCTGPYSGTVLVMPSQVYGVAAGEALPAQIQLVYHDGIGLGGAVPKAGDVWLVTVRQSEGQWFILTALSAVPDVHGDLTATPLGDDTQIGEEFSSDFYELSDSLVTKVENLESLCPSEANRRMSDEFFHDYYFDPTFRRGSNCHPDDGPQQQNSSEIDEEDLPPNGGTDDSIQP